MGRPKLSYEEVRDYIEKEGCKLLSTEYVNNHEKLLIQCSCGKPFEVNFINFKNGQKQCKKCGHKNGHEKQKNQVKFNCEYCGKECYRKKSHFEKTKHHFCSKECNDKFRESQVKFNCEYCGKKCSVKKSNFEGREHHFCSQECFNKWQSENLVGENNPRYNPNLTDEERGKKRNVEGYSEWVKAVFKRDGHTCQCCNQYSGKIHAHHINGYNFDKEHRVDPDNGITLCEDCHKEFHKIYGYGNNTIAQFREFLFNKYLQNNNLKFLSLIETIDLTTRAF